MITEIAANNNCLSDSEANGLIDGIQARSLLPRCNPSSTTEVSIGDTSSTSLDNPNPDPTGPEKSVLAKFSIIEYDNICHHPKICKYNPVCDPGNNLDISITKQNYYGIQNPKPCKLIP